MLVARWVERVHYKDVSKLISASERGGGLLLILRREREGKNDLVGREEDTRVCFCGCFNVRDSSFTSKLPLPLFCRHRGPLNIEAAEAIVEASAEKTSVGRLTGN